MTRQRKLKPRVKNAVQAYKTTIDLNCCNSNTNQRFTTDSASRLCVQLGVSRNILQEAFKHEFGMGIREYKFRQRMAQAQELLKAGREVRQTALMLHYTKVRTFIVAFKKYYGITPTAFKKTLPK